MVIGFYERYISYFLFFLLLASAQSSCTKEDTPSDNGKEEVSDEIQLVNSFILSYGQTYYLWTDKIDYSNKDPRYIEDPFILFEECIYDELDIWSYLTDDAESMFSSYQGVETTYGYNIVLGRFSNADSYFAVVKFVYANSPAEQSGIKRGDIILKINGEDISDSNYLDLYYSSQVELQMGEYLPSDEAIALSDRKVSMTAVKLTIDAVNTYKLIEEGTHKIGYICYTDYVTSSHEKLSSVFSEFKAAGVTDLVLDLRYNPGGASLSAQYLSSLIVPKKYIQNRSIFLKELWNKELTEYLKATGEALYTEFDQSALPYNLDLDKVYILTTSGTASASEATIVGLQPYMDVVTIGTTTHGKYCAALLLQALDRNGNVMEELENWAMSLVVYKFANNNGFTDFTGGLEPDYEVEDDLIVSVYPFGDRRDAHLAKAIELITGTKASSAYASLEPALQYEFLKKETRQLNGRRGGYVTLKYTGR